MPQRALALTDIYKGFKFFQMCGRNPPVNNSLFGSKCMTSEQQIKDALATKADIWIDIFKRVEVPVFELAIKKVVQQTKFWPNEQEFANAVDWAQEEIRTEAYQLSLANNREAREQFSKSFSKEQRDKNKKVIAYIISRIGKKERLKVPYNEKVIEFGRLLYPDASDEWLKENYNDIANFKKQKQFCDNYCKGRENCPNSGRQPGLRVDKQYGYIRPVYYTGTCSNF